MRVHRCIILDQWTYNVKPSLPKPVIQLLNIGALIPKSLLNIEISYLYLSIINHKLIGENIFIQISTGLNKYKSLLVNIILWSRSN